MGKLFRTPDQCPRLEVLADLDAVLDRHERFRPVVAFGLKVDILLKFDDDGGPALSHQGGHPDAYVKLGNAEARARGLGDVTVYIDGGKYQDMTSRQRHGLLAHELYHIQIRTHKETTLDDDGREVVVTAPDLDDYGRPVVELVPDDWRITGFREVAEWYGEDSGEVRSYRAMGRMLAQAVMPFMGGDDDTSDGVPSVVRDTFAALLSVGHTESRARAALDAVPDAHKFRSVAELIDAVYQQSRRAEEPADHLDAVVSASRSAAGVAR